MASLMKRRVDGVLSLISTRQAENATKTVTQCDDHLAYDSNQECANIAGTWRRLSALRERLDDCYYIGDSMTGKRRVSPLERDSEGRTELHFPSICTSRFFSLINGCTEEEKRELLNAVNKKGETVLHCVTDREIIPWLLSSEPGKGRHSGFNSVLARDKEGRTALCSAALNGTMTTFVSLINGCTKEEKRELLNAVDQRGETLLHRTENNDEMISWLLSNEPGKGRHSGFNSVLARDNHGRTALHCVILTGRRMACFPLINGCTAEEKKELLNAKDKYGLTILHCASAHAAMITWLLSNEPGKGRQSGFDSVLRRDRWGRTALHLFAADPASYFALMQGCTKEEKRELLNAVDNNENTCLHSITGRAQSPNTIIDLFRYPEIHKWTNAQDKYGMTPLHLAVIGSMMYWAPVTILNAKTRCIETVQFLLTLDHIDPNIGIFNIDWKRLNWDE